MTQMNYATCIDYEKAKTVIFGVNTQCAGTAPTFSSTSNQDEFSADYVRRVDNKLFSLPENFKTGDALWDAGHLEIADHTLANEIEVVSSYFYELINNDKKPICLGGDHIIKYAALNALDQAIPGEYGVIYLDAHPDCEAQDSLSYSSILHHGFLLPSLTPRQIMLTGIRQFTEREASALFHYQPDIGIIKGSEFNSINLETAAQKISLNFVD
ncbi:TPA: arginase family protein [Legionella bozemanae]